MTGTPVTAARVLHKYLQRKKTPVPIRTVVCLLETCFYASMQAEEGRNTVLTVAYLDPRRPDPGRPRRIRPQRWTVHALSVRVPLTVRSLVKIAPSASPSSTIVAIHGGAGSQFIWGLVDQQMDFRNAFNLEKLGTFPRPGLFQIEIVGPGTLQIFDDTTHILTLRENRMVFRYPDVFSTGPVAQLCEPYIGRIAKLAIDTVYRNIQFEITPDEVVSSVLWSSRRFWINALCRILLRVQRRRHGGAVLLTPHASMAYLQPKYCLQYDRLERILADHVAHSFLEDAAYLRLNEDFVDRDSDTVPTGLYLDRAVASDELQDQLDAETGTIAFIASLSSVDGLVLLQKGLKVRAYGVEITRKRDPPAIFVSSEPRAPVRSLKRVALGQFGTRHRSMMRYCFARRGAIGFVVSQDGYVRCITRVEKRLLMWENIRIQGTGGW